MRARNVNLHIERLCIRGVSRAEGRRLAGVIREELGRLLHQDGGHSLAQRSLNIEQITPAQIRWDAGDAPRTVGVRIAEAIYRGLRHG